MMTGSFAAPGRKPMLRWLVLAVVSLHAPWSAADTIREYDWVTAGAVSGAHVLAISDNGLRTADFEFNDRGRGPKLHEVTRVDARGLLSQLELNGHSYMGAVADERFRVSEGKAEWNSPLENGSAPAGAHYWATEGTPERLAVLARALLASEDGSLPLLPAGTARIRRITDALVAAPGETAISLYAIEGLGLTPEYLWLDDRKELFALTLGWMGLAPRGQSAVLPELQKQQDTAEAEWLHALAQKLGRSLPQTWRLRNVIVVDVDSGTLRPGSAIEVRDGVIARIRDDDGTGGQEEDTQALVIDGGGHYVIPGLWDMHTHLSLQDGLLHIAAGVTTVRDLGNDRERLGQVIADFDSAAAIGPRVLRAGIIDRKGPYAAPTGELADSLEDALGMVRAYAQAGYPQIKVYSSVEPEWVAPIAAETHRQGMRLSGHIPSYMTAEQAVRDGYDEIQHINMLFLNFLAGPEDDTRTPLRFRLVAEKAGGLDLGSPQVEAFIRLLAERGVVVDPTVAIFDSMFRHRAGQMDPAYAGIASHLPPAVRRDLLAGEMDIDESNAAAYARSAEALLDLVGRLHRSGVPLVAGTDGMPGFTLHRELELYQQAGIPAAEVLRIATAGSARVMGVDGTTGSIAAGKGADLVLLRDNPLADINAVRAPLAVFKGGRCYQPGELFEAVGITPFTAPDAGPGCQSPATSGN